jgi:hypothetical protein
MRLRIDPCCGCALWVLVCAIHHVLDYRLDNPRRSGVTQSFLAVAVCVMSLSPWDYLIPPAQTSSRLSMRLRAAAYANGPTRSCGPILRRVIVWSACGLVLDDMSTIRSLRLTSQAAAELHGHGKGYRRGRVPISFAIESPFAATRPVDDAIGTGICNLPQARRHRPQVGLWQPARLQRLVRSRSVRGVRSCIPPIRGR